MPECKQAMLERRKAEQRRSRVTVERRGVEEQDTPKVILHYMTSAIEEISHLPMAGYVSKDEVAVTWWGWSYRSVLPYPCGPGALCATYYALSFNNSGKSVMGVLFFCQTRFQSECSKYVLLFFLHCCTTLFKLPESTQLRPSSHILHLSYSYF